MSVNEQNTGPHSDAELERELAALGHVYRSSLEANDANNADDVVPPHVDDAIRAAARRSVHARPQSLRKSWLFGWGGPVAAAAVVVLTVSIGLLSVEEQLELAPEELKKVIMPRASKPAPEANMPVEAAAAPQGRAAAALEKRAEKLSEQRYDKAAGASQDKGEVNTPRYNKSEQELFRQIPQAKPGSSVASGSLEPANPVRKSANIGQRGKEEVDLLTWPNPFAPFPAPAATPPARASALPPAPATPPLSGKAETVAPSVPAAFAKEKFDRDRYLAEPKKVEETRSAGLTSPVIAPQALNEGVAQNKPLPAPFAAPDALTDKAASRDAAQPALGAVIASGALQPSSGEKQVSAVAPQDFRTKEADKAEKAKAPQEWLKQITALKEQGKVKEAEEELAKFRKRYPEYVLPLELRK